MGIVRLIGIAASFGTIVLCLILCFFNPYAQTGEPLLMASAFLLVPACLELIAVLVKKPGLMFIAFFWSLPLSLYMAMTPGIFAMFGVTSLMYLVTGIMARRELAKWK